MKRVVLDTNVTISAFFWGGYPRVVYNLVQEEKVTLISSIVIEAELIRVLAYARFGLTPAEIFPLVNNLRKYIELITVKNRVNIVKEDPTDNIFLECALEGKADYIISGDHHLLTIGSYEGIQTMRAKDFLIKEGFITVCGTD